jgi:outer membrane protein assembly factor BamE (lipoprotein component of BamABCDE complex)
VATSARQAAILAGFAKLKVGQSREEVRQALGAPDKAQIAQGKLYNSPRCWVYMYKIKMRTSGPNTKDICVEVSFDSDGKLNWAMPENIAGLNEARSPGDR